MKPLPLSMLALAAMTLAGSAMIPVSERKSDRPVITRKPQDTDVPAKTDDRSEVASRDALDPRANSSKLIPTERSISMFEQRARLTPRDHRNLVILGRLHLRLAKESGNHRENAKAESVLRRALKIKPADTAATLCLARAVSAQHRFAEARALAAEVLERQPDNADALAAAGDAELQLGDYDAAKAQFGRLAELANGPPVLTRLAELDEITGNTARARHRLIEAHRKIQEADATDDTLAWYEIRLGDFLLRHGEPKVAAEHFREALLLNEESEPAVLRLGLAEAALGNLELAASILKSATQMHSSPEAWAALGDIHHCEERGDLAETCYGNAEKLFELQARADGAHSRTAALFYADRNRSLSRAMELIQIDLKSRRSVETLDALAWVQFRSGQQQQAIATIKQALAVDTQSAILHYHAGVIFDAVGNTNTARKHIETALATNPKFSLLFSHDARTRLKTQKAAG